MGKVLKAHPDIVRAPDTTSSICLVQVRSFDMYIPRSFIYSFSIITFPLGSLYEYFSTPKLSPILWCSNFSPFRLMLFFGAHGYTLSSIYFWKNSFPYVKFGLCININYKA